MILRDGSTTQDGRLTRLVQFDERSRSYPLLASEAIKNLRPRSYTWRINAPYIIDQGYEGSCVGHAVTNELMARPAEVQFDSVDHAQNFATRKIYWEAQKIDPWEGGAYPGAVPFYEGTSVLAGTKIAQSLGYFESYRWTFNIQQLVLGLGYNGPAVLGLWWYEDMYTPDEEGFIRPEGRIVGGHAILARGVRLRWKRHRFFWWMRTWDDVDLDRSYITLRNSWGPMYGYGGDAYVTLRDMETWINQEGEAVFYLNRKTIPQPKP